MQTQCVTQTTKNTAIQAPNDQSPIKSGYWYPSDTVCVKYGRNRPTLVLTVPEIPHSQANQIFLITV